MKREVCNNTVLTQEIKKKSQRSKVTLHLKELEEEKQNSKLVEGNIRAEINEIDICKTIEKMNETKNWFFEKVRKIDNLLARLIKKNRKRAQINKIRNENETETAEIQRIIRDY